MNILPANDHNALIIPAAPITIDLVNKNNFVATLRAAKASNPFKIGGKNVTTKSLNCSTALAFFGSPNQLRSLVIPHPIMMAPSSCTMVSHRLVTGCIIFLIGDGIPIPFAPDSFLPSLADLFNFSASCPVSSAASSATSALVFIMLRIFPTFSLIPFKNLSKGLPSFFFSASGIGANSVPVNNF